MQEYPKKAIFIDWISTPYHRSFNRAFFGSIDCSDSLCYVFDPDLVIDEVDCVLAQQSGGRFAWFWHVWQIIRRHRSAQIFFVTYDPLFLPLLSLILGKVVAYEHNTVPSSVFSKHAVFQFLFSRNIRRLCQFAGQQRMLLTLKQNAVLIGSPLGTYAPEENPSGRLRFVAPSYRADLSLLQGFLDRAEIDELIVKKSALSDSHHPTALVPVDHITLSDYGRQTVLLITVDDEIRGTGWFNEALVRNFPVVILTPKAVSLFEETFPGFPYIYAGDVSNFDLLEARIREIAALDVNKLVRAHRQKFKGDFQEVFYEDGVCSPF